MVIALSPLVAIVSRAYGCSHLAFDSMPWGIDLALVGLVFFYAGYYWQEVVPGGVVAYRKRLAILSGGLFVILCLLGACRRTCSQGS